MKITYKKKYWRACIAGMLALALLCNACEEFVEVEQPSSQLTSVAVFSDRATADAALANIYSKLRDSGLLTGGRFGIATNLGVYADELEYYGDANNPTRNFYLNALTPQNNEILGWWSNAYNQIYACNAVLEGVSASDGIAGSDKQVLSGEAIFLRALYHFYLVNLYGDIPYITTTDYRVNTVVEKLPVEEVYSRIIDDLEHSFTLLPPSYRDTERIRPNKSVVMALLARVYLYSGRWEEASDSASYLINNITDYPWESDLEKVFLKEASTTIWQLASQAPGQNTLEGQNFIFEGGPPSHTALRTTLVGAFEPGDKRKEYWTKEVTDGAEIWHQVYKYKQRGPTAASLEFSIQFRLSEQYLIRSEARAMQGDLIGAIQDLDKIRNAAGLPGTPAATQQELVAAIATERNVEFFAEGHRFFDLKRTGQLDASLHGLKPGWDTNDRLLPLPESELLKNENMKPQNPGY